MSKIRKTTPSLQNITSRIEDDPNHHLAGPFLPQTPLGAATPERSASPSPFHGRTHEKPVSPLLRWAVDPALSFKLILTPVVLYANWEMMSLFVTSDVPNPFAPIFLISGYVPDSAPGDPRYEKTYYDLVFIAYNIVFFSFVRQAISIYVSKPVAKYFGLKREAKIDRFAEQTYALVYFSFSGAMGYKVMTEMPTYWYRTEHFWLEYPHLYLKPLLKRFYLMQSSYWLQQLIVLVLGLEKPRKDYYELVAHHFVTLWLVLWSFRLNVTYIGAAVFMSMDIPDAFLAASKLLNYIQWERSKMVAFVTFICVWTYFRHYLNIRILWSVWYEMIPLSPSFAHKWSWSDGVHLPAWMRHQIFLPLFLLQLLNLFWYRLMLRILVRGILTSKTDDDRSDDEGDDEPDQKED